MTPLTQLRSAVQPRRRAGHPIPAAARHRAVVSWCAAGACVLLATACGTAAAPALSGPGGRTPAADPSGAAGTTPAASPGSTAGAHQVSLSVTLYPAGQDAPPTQFTLYCEPAGGTVPDPAAACAQLLADPGLFRPPSGLVMCPMIMAGGAHAVVYGTYLGRQIDQTITDGGCDLPRWVELRQIVG